MNILITGGAGFIGSHLAEELINKKDFTGKIVIIDNLSTGKLENLPKSNQLEFIEMDITDADRIDELFRKYSFDYIFHLAAIASVQDSIINPINTHKVNFDATLYLLEKARGQKNLKHFIFASSAAVYGDDPSLPCREDNPVNPISPYGVDKYASERYVINHCRLYGTPATVFRFFNIFGPRQNPTSPYSGVISIFAEAFKQSKPNITIFGDGKQTRDFVYVKDLVKIILNSLNSDKIIGEVYNIGTGRETYLKLIVEHLEEITGKKAKINYKSERQGDIKRSVADKNKIISDKIIDRFISVKEGLRQLMDSI